MGTILNENREYWTGRADGYSAVNQTELATDQRQRWSGVLCDALRERFPGRQPGELRVLDVGTGPGFFAILLAEAGYAVTAVDLTASMLAEARKNAGPLAEKIRFLEMDAEEPAFADGSFDAVVTRNLTWNLPHPEKAYGQWARLLKPGGVLLNFDANWYAYLFDETARAAFDADRVNSEREQVGDENVGENFDVMEDIARRLPLSDVCRPRWDLRVLTGLGLRARADEEVWQRVWSREEKINFASTPLFMITAEKEEE